MTKPSKMPRALYAAEAARLIGVGNTKFSNRVRAGIYRPARFRASDPVPGAKMFRPHEIVIDELMRKLDERATGILT
jgi:hypothetical protein